MYDSSSMRVRDRAFHSQPEVTGHTIAEAPGSMKPSSNLMVRSMRTAVGIGPETHKARVYEPTSHTRIHQTLPHELAPCGHIRHAIGALWVGKRFDFVRYLAQ